MERNKQNPQPLMPRYPGQTLKTWMISLLLLTGSPTGYTQTPQEHRAFAERLEALLTRNDWETALSLLQAFPQRLNPTERQWFQAWAYLLGNVNDALQPLCRQLRKQALNPAYLVCIVWWERQNEPKQAMRAWKLLLNQITAHSEQLVLDRARRLELLQQYARAQELLETHARKRGNPYLYTLERVRLYEKAGQHLPALRLLLKASLAKPSYRPAAEQMIRAFIERSDSATFRQIQILLENLAAEEREPWLVALLLNLAERERSIPQALRYLSMLERVQPTGGYHYIKWAERWLEQGWLPGAEHALRTIVQNPRYATPSTVRRARYLLLKVELTRLRHAPQPERAESLAQAFAQMGDYLAYAEVLGLLGGQPQRALHALASYQPDAHHQIDYLLLKGKLYLHTDSPWLAIPVLLDALELARNQSQQKYIEVIWWLAFAGLALGDVEWFQMQMERITAYPEALQANDALLWLNWLDETGTTTAQWLGQALLCAWQQDTLCVQAMLDSAQINGGWNIQAYRWWLIGEVAWQKGETKRTTHAWTHFLETYPESALAPWLAWRLFQIAYFQDDEEQARKYCEHLRARQDAQAYHALCRGWLTVWHPIQ